MPDNCPADQARREKFVALLEGLETPLKFEHYQAIQFGIGSNLDSKTELAHAGLKAYQSAVLGLAERLISAEGKNEDYEMEVEHLQEEISDLNLQVSDLHENPS